MFDNDDMFKGGFGGFGSMKMGSSFENKFGFDNEPQMKGGSFGLSKSTSTTTKTINGKTTTTKKTTIFK